MSRLTIPGLESPDPVLEREIRGRLDEVEAALEKAVRADSDMLAETAQYLLAGLPLPHDVWDEWDRAKSEDAEMCFYEAGSWGPKNADDLIEHDGRRWRRL